MAGSPHDRAQQIEGNIQHRRSDVEPQARVGGVPERHGMVGTKFGSPIRISGRGLGTLIQCDRIQTDPGNSRTRLLVVLPVLRHAVKDETHDLVKKFPALHYFMAAAVK